MPHTPHLGHGQVEPLRDGRELAARLDQFLRDQPAEKGGQRLQLHAGVAGDGTLERLVERRQVHGRLAAGGRRKRVERARRVVKVARQLQRPLRVLPATEGLNTATGPESAGYSQIKTRQK